jgi:pyroglutamyl-peptidase
MQTLVTGFGPFGAFDVNPSSWLAGRCGRPFRVLEVSYAAVDQFLEELTPDSFELLLMLGVAGTAQRMRFETAARNGVGTTPDVRGIARGPAAIEPVGPSILPVSSSVTLPDGGHWESSDNAGDYLCNYLFYRAARRFPDRQVCFIHLPPFEVLPPNVQLAQLKQIIERMEPC